METASISTQDLRLLLLQTASLSPDSPPDSESQQTGFSRLPPEILGPLLEMAALSVMDNKWKEETGWNEMYELLRAASLVCRGWRTESQRLLFKRSAVKYDPHKWERLVESPLLGFFQTRYVRLSGILAPLGRPFSLERFQGMEKLELFNFPDEKGDEVFKALCSPSLKELTSLTLDGVTVFRDLEKDLVIPFSLQSLTIFSRTTGFYSILDLPRPYPDFYNASLLAALPTSALTSFHLSSFTKLPLGIVDFLWAVRSQLLHLGLVPPISVPYEFYLVFPHLTVLKSLELRSREWPEILAQIPSHLDSLRLWTPMSSNETVNENIVAYTVEKVLTRPCLSQLSTICFLSLTHPRGGWDSRGRRCLERLKDRGVEFTFGLL